MDRTREFIGIVQATEIPQPEVGECTFGVELDNAHKALLDILKQIGGASAYEGFRIRPLISRGQELLNIYRRSAVPRAGHGATAEVVDALRGIIRANASRAGLRLNEAARRCNKPEETLAQGEGDRRPSKGQQLEAQALQEETRSQEFSNETLQGRRRIVRAISEIGQMVEDISIHASLQEEQLKRIDELTEDSQRWNDKAFSELQETLKIVGENRRGMYYFFGGWAFVFFLFWLVKR